LGVLNETGAAKRLPLSLEQLKKLEAQS